MPSKKTPVIEWLFFNAVGFNPQTHEVGRPVVYMVDVANAIQATKAQLDKDNIANFWKDLTRSNPDSHWPAAVLEAGYTGNDAIGHGNKAVFEFVRLPPGQRKAFKPALEPSEELKSNAHKVQSLSMPIATKELGRRDENWLAQVGVRLFVVETHFAVFSERDVKEVTFLQTGVKMGRGETDVAYGLVDGANDTWLVSVEAKGRREKIHEPQVLRAAKSLAKTAAGKEVTGVIPFAIKIIGRSLIYTVEFNAIRESTDVLTVASQGVIELVPDVRGIS